MHPQAPRIRNPGHECGLKILRRRQRDEFVGVRRVHHDRHPFLRFGNCQFGSIQSFIFFRHRVQINLQPGRQFADRHRHAAGAKIIALLDHAADRWIAEQALDFTFGRRVALLHFGAACGQGFFRMRLGRAGSAAAAVPSRPTTDQDDGIPCHRAETHHIRPGSGGDDRADFHAFRHIPRMIDFRHLSRGESDLVAIGTVSGRRDGRDFSLRQFAGQGVFQSLPGIAAAGNPHRLIHIGTARQRIPDCSAQTGRRAAERFDLRRMVVGFIFKHDQPFFGPSVHHRVHDDAAGVVFLGFFQIRQFPGLSQFLHADGRQIHQAHFPRLFAVHVPPRCLVRLIGGGNRRGKCSRLDFDPVYRGKKSGVPTMIGPVGIDHPDFRNGRLPFFGIPEIRLTKSQIGLTHRQPQFSQILFPSRFRQLPESGQNRHIRRCRRFHLEAGRFCQRGFPGLDGIDAIRFDGFKLAVGNIAIESDHLGGKHVRAFFLRNGLNALRGPISPLIVLPGKVLHGKDPIRIRQIECLVNHLVGRRFGKNDLPRQRIFRLIDARHIIAVDQPQAPQSRQTDIFLQILQKRQRLHIKSRSFFRKNPLHLCHAIPPSDLAQPIQ